MTRRTLNICLMSPGGEGDPKAQKALVETFQPLVSPVLPVADPTGFAIDLDDPALPRLVKVLQDAIGKRRLATLIILRLDEEFVQDPAHPAEWYELQIETELIDMGATALGFPLMKADRVVSNTHTAAHTLGLGYVSEAFKEFVEQRGLRGLDFIWLRDAGRYRARQWYFPLADRMLGRGLDHEGFDPARIEDNWWMTSQPGWRTGVVKFKADQTRRGVSLGRADADALLALAENGRPREVFGHRRYLREFLPKDVDFAFIWTWHDSVDVTSAGNNRMRTSRRLCVNRRARELLIEAKLVPSQGFQPLCVLNQAPPGATVLDRRGDPGPGPLVSAEWLARLREEERAGLKAFLAKPKPPRPTSLPNSLKVLKSAKRANPESFPKGASAKQLDQLAAALAPGLPEAWRKVLAVSNGFNLEQAAAADGAAVRFSPAKALPGEQDDHAPFLKELYGAKAKRVLYIGDTYHGDLFVLRTDNPDKSGDCPAVLVNHESGGDLVTWPSVAAMLDDLLQ